MAILTSVPGDLGEFDVGVGPEVKIDLNFGGRLAGATLAESAGGCRGVLT